MVDDVAVVAVAAAAAVAGVANDVGAVAESPSAAGEICAPVGCYPWCNLSMEMSTLW